MKTLSDSELKIASILDFTGDVALIRAALDDEFFELSDAADWDNNAKMISLFAFAEHTKDNTLVDRLKSVFEKEMAAIFNE
jgi:hypothetical protein